MHMPQNYPSYRNNPDYEVVGIVEPDEQLRKAAQDRDPWRNLPWMTREQLLSTPGLQAVLVETAGSVICWASRCCLCGLQANTCTSTNRPDSRCHSFAAILQAAERQKAAGTDGLHVSLQPGHRAAAATAAAGGWLDKS
ncbi:MAG UNVERIFIED_CONTAM: hypothetical protein LVR18_24995 [Planctomycetaceae bacterium]|jgi:hypothetical protein